MSKSISTRELQVVIHAQKKSDVTMIAPILSKLLKEEEYYKNLWQGKGSLDTVKAKHLGIQERSL